MKNIQTILGRNDIDYSLIVFQDEKIMRTIMENPSDEPNQQVEYQEISNSSQFLFMFAVITKKTYNL